MGAKRQPHMRGAEAPRLRDLHRWARKWGPLLGAIAAIFAIVASIVTIAAFLLQISGCAGSTSTTITDRHVNRVCVGFCEPADSRRPSLKARKSGPSTADLVPDEFYSSAAAGESRYPASPIISCAWSFGSTLTGTWAPGWSWPMIAGETTWMWVTVETLPLTSTLIWNWSWGCMLMV